MSSNQRRGRIKERILIVAAIIGAISAIYNLGSASWDYFNKPALIYDDISRPLPIEVQKSVCSIVVRNEGGDSADEVKVKVEASAEIENFVLLQRDIARKRHWSRLPAGEVKPVIEGRSGTITFSYISEGTEYLVDVIMKSPDGTLIQDPIVESKNGGRAEKYVKKSGLASMSLARGFASGVILTVASLFLFKRFKRHREKG